MSACGDAGAGGGARSWAGRGAGCRGLWLACLLALGAPALAGRLGGGPQLGDAAPWPEAVADLSRDVRVFVRFSTMPAARWRQKWPRRACCGSRRG